MTATAPLYFDHELKVQQSEVDARFTAHCGFNLLERRMVMGKSVPIYENYFCTGWHCCEYEARAALRQLLELAGWSTPE